MEIRDLRTGRIFLAAFIIITIAAVAFISTTARLNALEAVSHDRHSVNPAKKGVPAQDSNTLGIVAGDQTDSEIGSVTDEIVALVTSGQETGPHGEAVLKVVPIAGKGGFQDIRDVATLAEADMSIVAAPLLDRAPAALGMSELRQEIVYVAPLFKQQFHLLASWSIADFHALAGKTINLGQKDGTTDVLGREIFDRLGVSVRVTNLAPSSAIEAMGKGEVDAVLLLSSKPVEQLLYDSWGYGFRLIAIPPVPESENAFFSVALTNGDYPNLIPAGMSVNTLGVRLVLIAHNWPKGTGRYRLLEYFVRAFFSRLPELAADHHPRWQEVDLAGRVPGWTQFPPAERWLDEKEFERFLSARGIKAPPDRARLFQDFLRLRK